MKKLILFLIIFCSVPLFSQDKRRYIDDVYFQKSTDSIVKYSDLATIKQSSYSPDYLSYLAKDGAVYKIGDRLQVGFPSSNKNFAFIITARGYLDTSISGSETEISKIFVSGDKRTGYSVYFSTKGFGGVKYKIAIENAIAKGEIKSFGMTSDEALSNLKKAKDKLDLGLITQAKYDSMKFELVKFIK